MLEKPKGKRASSREAAAAHLDELFSPVGESGQEADAGTTRLLPLAQLELWDLNPRKYRSEEDLRALGESLREHGQIQNLVVRPHPDKEKRSAGIYQIVVGGTRFKAAAPEFGDLPALKAEVRELGDKEALDLAWSENAKRRDPSTMDHARYFLMRRQLESNGTHDSPASLRAIEKATGYTYERIRQYLSLLSLPEDIQEAFDSLPVNEKHGRALLMLADNEQLQRLLFDEIRSGELSGNRAIERAKVLSEKSKTASPVSAKQTNKRTLRLSEDPPALEEKTSQKSNSNNVALAPQSAVDQILSAMDKAQLAESGLLAEPLLDEQVRADIGNAVQQLEAVVMRLKAICTVVPQKKRSVRKKQ